MSKLKTFLSPTQGLWTNGGIALVRITTGLFMAFHGWEIFDQSKMNEYSRWLIDLSFPFPMFMVYLGKMIELLSGIFIAMGFLTRIAVIPLAMTMIFISFGIGHGRIFMEDQHPFLFVLLALVFFFAGPGKWSIDQILFSKPGIK